MNRSHRSRLAVVAYGLLCLIAIAGSVRGGFARSVQFAPVEANDVVAPPLLAVMDYDEATDQVLVAGSGFTPGGEVYLAIYDQMGRQLYENRRVTASSPVSTYDAGMRRELGRTFEYISPGGELMEGFGGLCGAAAMIRALDNATERWSNWQVIQPPCGSTAGPTVANDLLRPETLPALNPTSEGISDDLNPFLSTPGLLDISLTSVDGMIVVSGENFTPGGDTYVAVYDLMGATLYETRWSQATPLHTITGPRADVPEAQPNTRATGGLLFERFAGLCGATVMVRAYDVQTSLWSNWLEVAPYCGPVEAHGFGPH